MGEKGLVLDLKIAHITLGLRWAGMEAHIFNLASALHREKGCRVYCITFGESIFTQRLEEEGVPVKIFFRRGRFNFGILRELAKFIKRQGFHVIHCHGNVGIMYGFLAGILAGTPVRIVTLHSSEANNHSVQWLHLMPMKMAKWMGARFISVSEDIRREMVQYGGIHPGRIYRIYNGISPPAEIRESEIKAVRDEMGAQATDLVVTVIGRLETIKGHHFFLQAACDVLKQDQRFLFTIIGDGPLEQKLKAEAKALGIDPRVRFLGFKSEVKPYIGASDVLVISSLHEGIPYVLLEAMSLACPIVASRTGGLLEVLKNNEDALTVSVGSIEEIKTCLLRLARDRPFALKLGEKAKCRQLEEYTDRKMAEQTRSVYQDLYRKKAKKGFGQFQEAGALPGTACILTNHPGREASLTWARSSHFFCSVSPSRWSLFNGFLNAYRLFIKRSGYQTVVLGGGAWQDMWYLILQRFWPFNRRPIVKIDCLWHKSGPLIQPFKRILFRFVDRVVDRYVVWARHEISGYSSAFGLPPEKFIFIPYHTTVNAQAFEIKDKGYLFSGGNFSRDYGTLAKAVEGTNLKVIIACNNSSALEGIQFQDNVSVVGVEHREFMRLMAESKINVVAMEALGLHSGGQQTFLNAMVMGKPVIVTDPEGGRDYIEDGVEGLLVPPKDPEKLRDAIRRFLNNPEMSAKIGEAGRNKASRWDTEANLSAVANLAKSLAKEQERAL